MTTLSPQTQSVIEQFGQQPGVTADQVLNLRRVIDSSPSLAAQIDAAVLADQVRHFSLLPIETSAGGTYDGTTKTINLRPSILSTPNDIAFNAPELAFVVGHEIQHSFNHSTTQEVYAQFGRDVQAVSTSSRDYTNAIGDLIAGNRRDEATAQLAGWNALLGMMRAQNPDTTLRDMYNSNRRTHDFVERIDGPPTVYAMKPNLTVNEDLLDQPAFRRHLRSHNGWQR